MITRFLLLALILGLLIGCTTFSVQDPNGYTVSEKGGFLVGRQAAFEIRHEWLDEKTNVLHEVRITRNVDEKVDAQQKLIEILGQLAIAGINAGAVGSGSGVTTAVKAATAGAACTTGSCK